MNVQSPAYVRNADRMVVAAGLAKDGLWVRFADEREGVVPLADLKLPGPVTSVSVPSPWIIHLHMHAGGCEVVPWDFARHFADPDYRSRSDAAADRDRRMLGEKLRAARRSRRLTQSQLAEKAGVSRVTIARIEAGQHAPRYDTLVAIVEALPAEMVELLANEDEAWP